MKQNSQPASAVNEEIYTPQQPPLKVEDLEKKPSKGYVIFNNVINILLVLAIVAAAVCTYVSFVATSGSGVPSILGIRVFSVQTDSMYPEMSSGDMIFGKAVSNPEDLVVGDIITYWTVINGERVLNTHRISEIYDGGGYRLFQTKGDNNSIEDALTVHESEVVGQYMFKIEGVGKAFDYLQTSTGFLLVVVLPVFLFFIFHLIQFFRVLFEYQNVKNRIKYEQERGKTEDLLAEKQALLAAQQAAQRVAIEAEMRERLKAELLASMQAEQDQKPESEPVAESESESEPEAK